MTNEEFLDEVAIRIYVRWICDPPVNDAIEYDLTVVAAASYTHARFLLNERIKRHQLVDVTNE